MYHPHVCTGLFPVQIVPCDPYVFLHGAVSFVDVNDFEAGNGSKIHRGVAKPKKKTEHRWAGRADKQGFSHPWLLTSLKGHTGQVLDMDFSVNGKYLITCADGQYIIFNSF